MATIDPVTGKTVFQSGEALPAVGTPAYNAAANTAQPGSTPIIDGSKLGVTSPTLPQAQPVQTNTALSMDNNATAAQIKTDASTPTPAPVDTAANNRSLLQRALQTLTGNISNQANQESALQDQYKLTEKKQKATALATELDTLDKQFRDQVNNIRKNPTGKLEGALNADITNAQRDYEDRRANIALAYKVASEDYQGADQIVTQKVNALKEQNAQQIQLFNAQKDMVYNDMTASEKQAADEQSAIRLNRAKTVEDTYASILRNASINKAPASVLTAIDTAAKDPNATPASIQAAAGQYGVDTASMLDVQYKKAQISNIYSEIANRNANSNPGSVITPPIINPQTGKLDPSNQLAAVIAGAKAKDNVGLQAILGVVSATQQFAEQNPDGKFAGLGMIRPGKFTVGPQGTANQSAIEAINLKVQQWASGAALTEAQTKQVEKITPKLNDTNKIVKQKTNALVNFMTSQARGALASQGINYTAEPIDFFKPAISENDISKMDSILGQ